jgi:hypothetical protein
MVEALRLRLQCHMEIGAAAGNEGRQSAREMKRDAAALMRLGLKGFVNLKNGQRGPVAAQSEPQGTLPQGWQTRGLSPMEDEINGASALIELLGSELSERLSALGNESLNSAAAGLLPLAQKTMTSLRVSFESAWAYYRALPDLSGAAAAGAVAAVVEKAV